MNLENSVVIRHEQEERQKENFAICLCGKNKTTYVLRCTEENTECSGSCDYYPPQWWKRLWLKFKPQGPRPDCEFAEWREMCEYCGAIIPK